MNQILYPLFFAPVYQSCIWGGNEMARLYGRKLPSGKAAESWEIADRPQGMSVVSNGPFAGRSLHEMVDRFGSRLMGTASKTSVFPLLIKIIDAKQRLSVQVHPDENSAAKYGGEPKTEAWYVLKAARGSKIFAGLNNGVGREQFETATRKRRLEKALRAFPARSGSIFYVPGGRLHAIGEGCVILEVQQNSDTTYRVYDWERMDSRGKSRELHVDKARQVINWNDHTPALQDAPPTGPVRANGVAEIFSCPYFRISRRKFRGILDRTNNGKSFHILFAEKGPVEINAEGSATEKMNSGATCLMPASVERYRLKPAAGSAVVLTISAV